MDQNGPEQNLIELGSMDQKGPGLTKMNVPVVNWAAIHSFIKF